MDLKASLTQNCKREGSGQWHPHRKYSLGICWCTQRKYHFLGHFASVILQSFLLLLSLLSSFFFFLLLKAHRIKPLYFHLGLFQCLFFPIPGPWHVFALLFVYIVFLLRNCVKDEPAKENTLRMVQRGTDTHRNLEKWNLNWDYQEGFLLSKGFKKNER